ncbi:MAG TPA: peptidylprolyl isomerase [Bryobacteraceae bacterium]|nr:peptidylprolyl isomerase [Bryobacteraceae bacterium]
MQLLFPIALLVSGSVFAADLATVEEIVAKCNGDIITRTDLARTRQQLVTELRESGLAGTALEQALADREKNLLRDKIDQLLLVQKAKDLDINVDSDVSKRMSQIQQDSGIADPDKFHEYIKEQSGLSFEDFKDEMKKSLLTQRVVRQEVSDKIPVKHEDVEKYYNEHKSEFVREEQLFLREILISTENKDAAGVAAAEKKAKDLVSRARRGERFAEMARDNSDSPSAKDMGALPPFKKGSLAKDLEDLVWNQPKGYITDPIRRPNGFLILRVEEHQKAGQAELSEVENEVMDRLMRPRMEPAMREFLGKLRQDAFLEIKADYVDTGAAAGKDTAWVDPAQLKPETVSKAEVANVAHRKRLLWMVPVPGTSTGVTSSSSK